MTVDAIADVFAKRLVGDKGDSSRRIRRHLRQHGIRCTIPRKRNECRRGPFDRAV